MSLWVCDTTSLDAAAAAAATVPTTRGGVACRYNPRCSHVLHYVFPNEGSLDLAPWQASDGLGGDRVLCLESFGMQQLYTDEAASVELTATCE